ncbi:MAG: SusC/RagA family TonB-linked outer membrane protein, partial [Candidatus Symbiothrix sp.]|nr:SusC/RagA family TonB-linked outer membrane protein [Candidatus Symbiothrix sp.]
MRKEYILICLFSFLLSIAGLSVHAQSPEKRTVSGTVTDENGEILPGASIVLKGSQTGSVVDISGNYSINVPDNKTVLQVTLLGYVPVEIPVKGKTIIDIVLTEDAKLLEEVVVVGYGVQKKATLSGAISVVGNKEIKTATNANVENLLTGKLPGLRVQQRTGEPGDYSTRMDIRGFGSPLIVIDGIISDEAGFKRLESNEIENISVLKDASAAIYGVRAANGVLLVTTRRGKGKTVVEYSGTYGFQQPSGLPDVLNSYQYAELVREADKNMGRGIDATFTGQDLENFRNGLTPTTDWADLVIRKSVPQIHQNISVNGGNERSDYFVSFAYYQEDGIWKSGDLNYERFNLRSNVGFNITDRLRGELLITGVSDEKNQPYRDTWEQFKSIWMLKPTDPVYTNNNPGFLQDMMYGLHPLATTYADQSGYKTYKNRNFNTVASLKYDAPFLPGLSAKFVFGFTYDNQTAKQFQKQYTLYNYDDKDETYNAKFYNTPSSIRRRYWENLQILSQFQLNYEKSFARKHNLKALFTFEQQDQKRDNFWVKKQMELDAVDQLFAGSDNDIEGSADTNKENLVHLRNLGLIGRVNYDYLSKYIAELSFRRDGLSKYAPDHRWGFFPAASLAYRVSEEDFFKNLNFLSFVSNLKLRVSYGEMGDDYNTDGYQFLEGFSYPGQTYIFGDSSSKGLRFLSVANINLTWMTVKTLNLGGDLDLWNGLFGAQLDFFRRYRDGIPANRGATVPGTFGGALPDENLNSDLYKGFEVIFSHFNRINDFEYSVSMNFALTRRQYGNKLEGDATSSWDRWKNKYSNRYGDMGWTYGSNGQFSSMYDIWNSPIQDGQGGSTQLPGDWKYEDWNEDGIIDGNDMYPNSFEHFGDSGNPKMTYGSTV